MKKPADRPAQALTVVACLQMMIIGGVWIPWHLGILAVPSVLTADDWLLHEVQFGAVPLLVALGAASMGRRMAVAVLAAWVPGRLVASFMPEPPLLLAAGAAALLPALVAATLALKGPRRPVWPAMAVLAASAVLLHWQVWRYGQSDSGWLTVAAGSAGLIAAAGRPVRRGVVLFLVLGVSLAMAGIATGSFSFQRAGLAALTLGAAGQALGGDGLRLVRRIAGAGVALLLLALAAPAAIAAPIVGWLLWVAAWTAAAWKSVYNGRSG